MTLDEFREAEEEPGFRYELAHGVLEVIEFSRRRRTEELSEPLQGCFLSTRASTPFD